jgi:hypothetical protein
MKIKKKFIDFAGWRGYFLNSGSYQHGDFVSKKCLLTAPTSLMVTAPFKTEVFLDPDKYSFLNFSNIRTAYIIPNTGL